MRPVAPRAPMTRAVAAPSMALEPTSIDAASSLLALGIPIAAWLASSSGGHAAVEDDEAFAVACEQTNGDFFVTGMSKGDAFGPNEGKEDVFVLRLSGDDLFDSLESPTPAREKKSAVTLTKKQQTMAIIVVCVAVPLLCFLGYLAGKIRTEQKFEALREVGDRPEGAVPRFRHGELPLEDFFERYCRER